MRALTMVSSYRIRTQQRMTTIIAYYQTVGDAALKGAIQGGAVVIMVSAVAGLIWFSRQWRKWFAKNTFMRIVLPFMTLGGFLTWNGSSCYQDGGWTTVAQGMGGLAIFVLISLIVYLKWKARGSI
jgi:hypothetical protein